MFVPRENGCKMYFKCCIPRMLIFNFFLFHFLVFLLSCEILCFLVVTMDFFGLLVTY